MKIKEIKGGMENIEVVGKIVEIGETREVETKYGYAAVAAANLQDETGTVRLNLWRDQIRIVKVGDLVRLTDAFAKSFKGELELSLGRQGKITVLTSA